MGQAAAGIGSLVSVRLLTHFLSPEVFGDVALSLTAVMILQYCYAGTSASAMRFFVPAVEKGQFGEYLGAAWRMQHRRNLILIPLVIGGLGTLLLIGYVSLVPLVLAALAIAVISSYGIFMDGLQNAARQRAVVALHQGANSWLRMGCAVMLVAFVSNSAAGVLWGFALAAALTMASQYFFYRVIKSKTLGTSNVTPLHVITRQWQASMTSYAWPYVIWAVPAWLQFSSDRWALDWFMSSAEVGIYAAVCQLAFLPIYTMTQLITQLAMPILFARAGDLSDPSRVASTRSLNSKIVNISLFWTICAVIIVYCLQAQIGYFLLDPRYHGALSLLPLVVLAAGIFATSQLVEIKIITANQTAALIRPKIIVAILACAAFFSGAYLGGIAGVVWASIITRLGLLVWIEKIDRQIALHKKG